MSKTTLTTALGCLLASLVCCTAISCGNNNAAGNDIDDKSTVSDSLNSTLSSAEATEGFMNDELILNGSVTCDESKVSKVFIPCSGKIQGVRVEVGDYVTNCVPQFSLKMPLRTKSKKTTSTPKSVSPNANCL